MAYYARIRCAIEASEYSDYGSPDDTWHEMVLTPDEWIIGRKVEVDASGAVTITHNMATITSMTIKNEDSSNALTVTWSATDYSAGASANAMHVGAGKFCVLSEVTAGSAITLRADTAAVSARLSITGT